MTQLIGVKESAAYFRRRLYETIDDQYKKRSNIFEKTILAGNL